MKSLITDFVISAVFVATSSLMAVVGQKNSAQLVKGPQAVFSTRQTVMDSKPAQTITKPVISIVDQEKELLKQKDSLVSRMDSSVVNIKDGLKEKEVVKDVLDEGRDAQINSLKIIENIKPEIKTIKPKPANSKSRKAVYPKIILSAKQPVSYTIPESKAVLFPEVKLPCTERTLLQKIFHPFRRHK